MHNSGWYALGMPRNMSFSLTTPQIQARTKTVTRRKGWRFLQPGDVLNACEKCMGLKPGEKVRKLCQIQVISVQREPLRRIYLYPDDVTKEGFPGMSPTAFVAMFMQHMGGSDTQDVTRIEFTYV